MKKKSKSFENAKEEPVVPEKNLNSFHLADGIATSRGYLTLSLHSYMYGTNKTVISGWSTKPQKFLLGNSKVISASLSYQVL